MKTKTTFILTSLLLSSVAIFFACKALDIENLMAIKTLEVSNITINGAIVEGDIIDLGNGMTDHGVYYAVSPNAQNGQIISLSKPSAIGQFMAILENLEPGVTYYTRTYGATGSEFVYGDEKNFTTLDGISTVITDSVFDITSTSASCVGNITADGGDTITARGVCYNTNANPTLADSNIVDGRGTGIFTSSLTGLAVNATYYVRAYATNSVGTVYGNEISFTTAEGLPQITTSAISIKTATGATSGGNITSDGGFAITVRGVCYSTGNNPTTADSITNDGSGIGVFTSSLTDLTVNTTYYVRAYATNSLGTVYGNEQTFATLDGKPQLITQTISGINGSKATSGGSITSDGGFAISARGVCYSTDNNPTIADSITIDGSGTGVFISSLTDLTVNTTYYVRAYATTSVGTVYGNEQTFNTTNGLPQLTTTTTSDIFGRTATSGGSITSDGGFAISARGVCYSTSNNPSTADSKTTNGSGTGSFISNLTGLTPNTSYYVRAYATNSVGVVYGNEKTFTTTDGLPRLIITGISSIKGTTATIGSSINSDGGIAVTVRGVCYSTGSNPTIEGNIGITTDGSGMGNFTSNLTGLTLNTSYYVRAYATNSVGNAYSNELSFTTADGLPQITTKVTINKTATGATSGGAITSDGGFAVSLRGVCYSTSSNPTIADSKTINGSGEGSFTSSLTGLTPFVTYYVRAYATNIVGTIYGNEQSLATDNGIITGQTGTLTDYDGNTYNWVGIGKQVWMAENLKVTHYPDGNAIPLVTDNTAWGSLGDNNTDAAYCYYNNESSNQYGALYTYAAAKNACPTGWHLPSDAEWTTLENYISNDGHSETEGTALKAISGWDDYDDGMYHYGNGTDDYSFSALPGGMRGYDVNTFTEAGSGAHWWNSTTHINNDGNAYARRVYYNSPRVYYYSLHNKSNGFSVRCIRD